MKMKERASKIKIKFYFYCKDGFCPCFSCCKNKNKSKKKCIMEVWEEKNETKVNRRDGTKKDS